MRNRFRGEIVGVGSSSGVRVVVGRWTSSPLGAFADVMVETAAGHRVLLAPSAQVAEFVESTYSFDSVRIEDVRVETAPDAWSVRSRSLVLEVTLGSRTSLGLLLRLVPARIAESPAWCTVTDLVARVVLRGVRTRGTAGGGRREYYGATDHRAVTALSGSFDGADLGELRPVRPSPRFGFSSTPASPSVTRVVTTVSW
ncbi:hypothetical protein ABIE44_001505 [Marmoricola sp. OAE513]|uniref:hypothetical protein n=1 Tax=Marmoricola sp. OAE513 TaxID=2817894 RepID=UPI001AE23F7C